MFFNPDPTAHQFPCMIQHSSFLENVVNFTTMQKVLFLLRLSSHSYTFTFHASCPFFSASTSTCILPSLLHSPFPIPLSQTHKLKIIISILNWLVFTTPSPLCPTLPTSLVLEEFSLFSCTVQLMAFKWVWLLAWDQFKLNIPLY